MSGKERGKEWKNERMNVYYLKRCKDPVKEKRYFKKITIMIGPSPWGMGKYRSSNLVLPRSGVVKLLKTMVPKASDPFPV